MKHKILPFLLVSSVILNIFSPIVYAADSSTIINGTTKASTIDVSASGTANYTINGKSITSDTIGIINNSNFPISIGVAKVEKTLGNLLDVLPELIGNKYDWYNLGKTESNSKIALGLKHTGGDYLEEFTLDTLFFKNVQDSTESIGLGALASKGNAEYQIDGFHGLAFSSDISEQYKITWDIGIYEDYTYIDEEENSIYVYSFTDYDTEEDGISGTAIIQALKTAGTTEMIVPEYRIENGNRYKVIGLGNGVFAGRSAIEKITLPSSIESIGEGTFQACSNLQQINIPKSCMTLGGSAFYECKNLKSIYLPDGLTFTGVNIFYNSGIESIRLPEGITTLPTNSFSSCTSLKIVVFPSTLECVEQNCFDDCNSLLSLDIPSNVTVFDDDLYNCSNLSTVYVHTQALKDYMENVTSVEVVLVE